MLISLQNVSKNYSVKDSKIEKDALRDINLTFGSTGMVSIVGKSGSGKSTLLNILGLIDKPSSGKYFFNDSDTSNWKKKRVADFHNSDVGIIFQNYQLLEDLNTIDNISLPMLIAGKKKKESLQYAQTLLSSIGFSEELSKKRVSDLSGGEKQRVAILRSVVNNPKMILCDEPTGALDSANSVCVMEMLKKISKKTLVILVSHNVDLVQKFSDRIITIKDGLIDGDEIINERNSDNLHKNQYKHSDRWIDSVVVSNVNRRKRRNLISLFALSFSLIASTLVLGFIKGSSPSIEKESYKHLDYGSLTVSKETSTSVNNTFVSLIKQSRPNKEDLKTLKNKYPYFFFELNYDSLVSPYQTFSVTNTKTVSLSFLPIYSFKGNYFDKTLLLNGRIPSLDSFYEVVVNKKAYNILKDLYLEDCIDKSIRIKSEFKHSTYTLNDTNEIIDDYLIIDKALTIVGVVDELDFLSTPVVYYSYKSLDELLNSTSMNNLSKYYDDRYTWKDLVQYSSDNDPLSSYSYRVFLNDINNQNKINDLVDESYTFSSNAKEVKNALMNIIDASKIGICIFLAITLVGTVLIIGIISFSSYSDDTKRSAILSSIGARNSEIASLYVIENMFVGIAALLLTFALSPPLVLLSNYILNNAVGLPSLVIMPTRIIDAIPYSYYLFSLLLLVVVILCSTSLPLCFSKKFSIREEMQQE